MPVRVKAKRGTKEWKALRRKGLTALGNPRQGKEKMLDPVTGHFKVGNAGKSKGAKHQYPRGVKASIKAVLAEVAENEGMTIRKAVMEGLRGGPRNADRYIRMIAEYVDGKPKDEIDLNAKIQDETIAQSKNRINAKVATMVRNILKKKERQEGIGSE